MLASGKRYLSGVVRRQRGAAAIEFFLLFPLLLLLLYAAVSYAILFWAYQGLNGMSAELASQIVRQEWYDDQRTLDQEAIDLALQRLQEENSGPASRAELCRLPDIDDGILSVCLEIGPGGLPPQLSLLGVKLPHRSDASITSSVRLP